MYIIVFCLLLLPNSSSAHHAYDFEFPRLANLYLKTPLQDNDIDELVQWDVIILGMQEQSNSPDIIKAIRKKNPQIKIFAYVASQEFPVSRLDVIEKPTGPWHAMYAGIQDDWWLYRSDGTKFSSWPGNNSLNVASGWNTYLPQFMHDHVMSTGLWDGVYYDNVWGNVSWVGDGDMDMNRDGVRDSAESLDQNWRQGMTTLLKTSRKLEGKHSFVVGNGGNEYQKYLNGRLFENFPNIWPGIWSENVKKYYNFQQHGYLPTLSVINGAPNDGNKASYSQMRFALASTLLSDGFFSYDLGFTDHAQLWWYDEYNAALGEPLNKAYNVLNPRLTADQLSAGVWRRNFANGIVLVNSTDKSQKVRLEDGFEKILGTQDPTVNTGKVIGSVTVPANDGIILRGRITQVSNAPFINGSFAKVFDAGGKIKRNSFFSYNSNYFGGNTVQHVSKRNLTVVADSTYITVYKNGIRKTKFAPYGTQFTGGINFTVGQLTTNKRSYSIVSAPKQGVQPIKIFSLTGKLLTPGCFPFGERFAHGLTVSSGDVLKRSPDAEIVVAPASNAAPEITLLTKQCKVLPQRFMAYGANMRSGVSVGVGDVDNNGRAEIVTVPGVGGAPYVKVFNGKGKLLRPGFYAFNKSDRNGSSVSVSDIDGDGANDLVVMSFNIFNQ